MPFQSEKQRRFLHANHPEIAKRWEREYATGGISNHFRRKFFTGALADTQGPAGGQAMSPGTSTSGGTRHGGGGGNGGHTNNNTPPTHPIHTGPTAAELAARKAAAEEEARKKAVAEGELVAREMALRKQHKKKKVDHLKKIQAFGVNEYENLIKPGVVAYQKKHMPTYDVEGSDLQIENLLSNLDLIETLRGTKKSNRTSKNYLTDVEEFYSGVKPTPVGLNQEQTDYLDKVAKKGVVKESGQFFTYDSPDDVKKQLKKLDKKSEEWIGTDVNPDKIVSGDKKTYATDKDVKEYLQKKGIELKDDMGRNLTIGLATGGVSRKNYFHGGILDINESEEIISDDGNDIELTAYNAEFDDPNDLSTGVRTLFQAKDGGTPQLAKKSKDGKRPGYGGPHETYGGGVEAGRDPSPPDYSGGGGDGYQDRIIEVQERTRKQDLKDLVATGPGSDVEKYDTDLVGMSDAEKFNARRNMIKSKYTGTSTQRKNSLNTNYQTEKARLQKKITTDLIKKGIFFWAGGGFTIKDFVGIDWKDKKIDITGVLGDVMDLDKLKKTHINDLEDIKDSLLVDVDIFNPNEMANLDDTVFPDLMKDLKDLYKTRDPDDIENNEFRVPKIVPIGEEIESYTQQGPHLMSPWERIKANQAARAAAVPDWQLTAEERELKNNPIVMTANSGGLANLFRVKNNK